ELQRIAHLAVAIPQGAGVPGRRGTVRVIAPAFDRAISEERAGVRACRKTLLHLGRLAQVDGLEGIAHVHLLLSARVRIALAELTVPVFSPAFQRSVVEHRAGVLVTGANLDGLPARAQVDGGELVAHFAGSITP